MTDQDIVHIWNLHSEVIMYLLHSDMHNTCFLEIFQEQQLGQFQRLLPSASYFKFLQQKPSYSDKVLSMWLQYKESAGANLEK